MRGEFKEPWRFWSKVERDPSSGCWLWGGSTTPNGYGFGWNFGFPGNGEKQRCYAHRQSYAMAKGPVPTGLQIDHLCKVKNCVNPDHLEMVTQHENLLRAPSTIAAINKAKEACVHGHPFDAENTRVNSSGHRFCRACNRSAVKSFFQRNPQVRNGNAYRKAKS